MDLTQISEMVAAVCGSRSVTELTLREGASRLVIRRALAVAAPVPESAGEDSVPEVPTGVAVRSPLVGIFHQASGRHTPVAAGSEVREGQVIGVIESMRMPYEVAVESAGVIAEVLVEDGQPVEYGQDLFRIVPQER